MDVKLALAGSSGPIAERLMLALAERGHRAVRSFDLKSARASSTAECPCPYHQTADCACQYLVLMVYSATGGPPRTITLHEFEGVTRVTLDDPDGRLAGLLMEWDPIASKTGGRETEMT